jgi:hypothetical protein
MEQASRYEQEDNGEKKERIATELKEAGLCAPVCVE